MRVPLNARLAAAEQARMLQATGVRTLVFGAALAGRAAELAALVEGLQLLALGPVTEVEALDLVAAAQQASAADPMLPAAPDDPVLVLYTSGTTGALKAVVHTQASYAAICANVLADLVCPGRDSVMLHAASLIHASGTFVLPYWVRGGAAAVLPGFDPGSYLDALARYRATEINLVPTMLGMLLASGAAERADVASLRTVIYGASPMPTPVLDQVLELWGPRLVQYYGQTEAPLAITVLDAADHTDRTLWGSCGQPSVDAEVRLVAPGTAPDADPAAEGEPVAPGEVGELQVRAPFGMAGYVDAPDLTAQTITPDGWIRTRDLARADDRGYLTLVDRTSDMIITGGYNVYPREVEDALMAHPAVTGAAVVGAPDPTWVEAVTAFVTLRPDATVTPAELQDAVRRSLAGYKVPKAVHVVDRLPLSPVGKILRRALRDPLWAGAERAPRA